MGAGGETEPSKSLASFYLKVLVAVTGVVAVEFLLMVAADLTITRACGD